MALEFGAGIHFLSLIRNYSMWWQFAASSVNLFTYIQPFFKTIWFTKFINAFPFSLCKNQQKPRTFYPIGYISSGLRIWIVIRSIKRNRFKFCGRFLKNVDAWCMWKKNSASRHRATLKKNPHYLCEVKLNE